MDLCLKKVKKDMDFSCLNDLKDGISWGRADGALKDLRAACGAKNPKPALKKAFHRGIQCFLVKKEKQVIGILFLEHNAEKEDPFPKVISGSANGPEVSGLFLKKELSGSDALAIQKEVMKNLCYHLRICGQKHVFLVLPEARTDGFHPLFLTAGGSCQLKGGKEFFCISTKPSMRDQLRQQKRLQNRERE